MVVLLFVVFTAALFVATAAAVTGRRGQVCDRDLGYTVPAAVESDPALDRQANELVARWCTAAAVLAALPLVGLALHGFEDDLPLGALVALAVHGFVVVCVTGYPFERITQLGADARRRGPA